MGHHSVVSTAIAIVYHVTAVHQQVTITRIAAVKGLSQASHLVSAKQTSGRHGLIGLGGAIVDARV